MITVALPATLPGPIDLADLRRQLVAGTASLDWSAVRDAPPTALDTLLGGLDLVRDADALGLGTVADTLAPALLAALGQASGNTPGAPYQRQALEGAEDGWLSPEDADALAAEVEIEPQSAQPPSPGRPARRIEDGGAPRSARPGQRPR